METVMVSRAIDAEPGSLEETITAVEPFMAASGFDSVTVEGEVIRISNTVGLFLQIELILEIVERNNAVFAYEQRAGIFDEMSTVYAIERKGDRSVVTASTEFALDVGVVGPLFDATVVKRQRRKELTNQLEYLEPSASRTRCRA